MIGQLVQRPQLYKLWLWRGPLSWRTEIKGVIGEFPIFLTPSSLTLDFVPFKQRRRVGTKVVVLEGSTRSSDGQSGPKGTLWRPTRGTSIGRLWGLNWTQRGKIKLYRLLDNRSDLLISSTSTSNGSTRPRFPLPQFLVHRTKRIHVCWKPCWNCLSCLLPSPFCPNPFHILRHRVNYPHIAAPVDLLCLSDPSASNGLRSVGDTDWGCGCSGSDRQDLFGGRRTNGDSCNDTLSCDFDDEKWLMRESVCPFNVCDGMFAKFHRKGHIIMNIKNNLYDL